MVCKKCGAKSPQEAIFCSCCGYRLDEKKACPSCKKMNEKETIYCIYCGTRMDGKTVCKNCNTAHEGVFCPNCGQEESVNMKEISLSEEISVAYDEQRTINHKSFTKIVDTVAQIFGGIGLLFAVIFTFLIGFTTFEGLEGTFLDLEMEFSIYHYFGKAYENLGDIESSVTRGAVLFGIVLCTIIGASTFIYVIIAGIIGSYGYFLNLTNGGKESPEKWLLRGIAGFLFGVFGIYSITMIKGQVMGIEIEMIRLNTATKTGVILCIICAGIYILLKQISSWEKPNKRKICIWLSSLVSIVLLVLIFCLLVNSGVSMSFQTETVTGKLKMSHMYFVSCLDSMEYLSEGKLDSIFSLGIIGQLLSITLILSILAALIESVNYSQEKKELDWLFAATIFTTALLFMIFSICESSQALTLLKNSSEEEISNTFKLDNVQPILIFVFSAVNLLVIVISILLENYLKK